MNIHIDEEISTSEPWYGGDEVFEIIGAKIFDKIPTCFAITRNKMKIKFTDSCDYYQEEHLNKKEMILLSNELIKIAQLMEG